MQYGVIMAGGSGTRLWPLSRSDRPKQILPVVNGRSLLQLSYDRLRGMCRRSGFSSAPPPPTPRRCWRTSRELPRENLLGEPMGRDTANAVGFSAAVLHRARPRRRLCRRHRRPCHRTGRTIPESLKSAFEVIADRPRSLVDLRHRPHLRPHRAGIHSSRRVAGHRRRVPRAGFPRKARQSPGRPVRRVRPVLLEQRHVRLAMRHGAGRNWPSICPARTRASHRSPRPGERPSRKRSCSDVYPRLPKISIDYAVMEPASQQKGKASVVVVEMPVEWTGCRLLAGAGGNAAGR